MYLDGPYTGPVLTLYRRHTRGCPFFGKPRFSRAANACAAKCPIWVQGTLGTQYFREALDLRSWEAATALIRSWEANGSVEPDKPAIPTLKQALEKFFQDAAARGLASATIQKQRNVLELRLLRWAEAHRYAQIRDLDIDALRRFRATWRDAPITASKNLERLRNFFRFCVDSRWIQVNPASAIKPPRVLASPTLPFDEEDWTRLLEQSERFPTKGIYGEGNRVRLKAMLLLLRYSGLRIRDAATLERRRIKSGKLFLYTQKTGTPVYVPLPPCVLEAIAQVPAVNERYIFWSGNGDPKTTVADWQRTFRRLCERAQVSGHFHMIRDTAAVAWLAKGVPIETVSVLLGHSSIRITEKHYAPWVKSRQDSLEAAVRSAW